MAIQYDGTAESAERICRYYNGFEICKGLLYWHRYSVFVPVGWYVGKGPDGWSRMVSGYVLGKEKVS